MEKLTEEFKRKMYLDGKSARTVEVYCNSVKEFFRWFFESYGNIEFRKLYIPVTTFVLNPLTLNYQR